MLTSTPPQTITALLARAQSLRGYTLNDLAKSLQVDIPQTLKHAKGLTGQLLEHALGATAGSKPLPDFQDLGIELKTIPITPQGIPLESTYICIAPLLPEESSCFEDSVFYQKIKHMLWIPILTHRNTPFKARIIGKAHLWSPPPEILNALKTDWEELTQMLISGDIEKLSSHFGTYIQIRPKAANRDTRCQGIGVDGRRIETIPRGFYFRAKFTQQILKDESPLNHYFCDINGVNLLCRKPFS